MNDSEIYLDDLLGRKVLARNNRSVGRIEEFHSEQHGDYFEVVEIVIGAAGLMERLNVALKVLFGRHTGGRIARWDQVDATDPHHPRLTCSVEDLRPLKN